MSAICDRHTDNILIGSGHLFIDVLDAAGACTGERHLGDAVGAALAVESERVQVFSGSGPVARQLVNKVRSLTRRLTMTLHDASMENLALFVGAGDAVGREADAAARLTDDAAEPLAARKGRWFQLGVSAARPAGVRAVKDGVPAYKSADGAVEDAKDAVIVTDAKAAPNNGEGGGTKNILAPGEDYTVDAANGRIYIAPDGAIDDGDTVYVHYTPVAAASRPQVSTPAAPKEIRAALRYIEETQTGAGRNFYAPLCSVAASGELALMSRESEQRIRIVAEILEPGAGRAALLIDEQAA